MLLPRIESKPATTQKSISTGAILAVLAVTLIGFIIGIPSVSQTAAPEELATPESMGTQVVIDSDAKASPFFTGESLVMLVKKMVSFDVQGSGVAYNRNSGQLFVRNTPSNLQNVEHIINELRLAGKKQVDIEARIITISSTDFIGLGQNFLGFDITRREGDVGFGTSNEAGATTTGLALTGQSSYNTGVSFPGVEDADGITGGQFTFFGTSNRVNIETAIDALESIGEVNTLSSPRLTVFNNQRANIKIEEAQNYLSTIDYGLSPAEQGVAISVAIISAEAIVEVARSGTILDVTPTINANGTITLDLHPTFVRVDLTNTQTFTNRFQGADFGNTVTLPVYDKQALDTTLTIPNGGVAVLGGLITETENLKLRKTPFYGDIPFIGKWLFQNEQNEHVRSYLIMFVRATVRDAEKNKKVVDEER